MIDIKYKKVISFDADKLQKKDMERFDNRFGFENFIKNHNSMLDYLNKE